MGALRGFLKCLGLEGGEGTTIAGGEEAVTNQKPPPSPLVNTTASLPAADDTPTALDPLVDVLSSPIDRASKTTTDIDTTYAGADINVTLVAMDKGGDTIAESHYVELLARGQPNMTLLTTSLISSGGGGKSH